MTGTMKYAIIRKTYWCNKTNLPSHYYHVDEGHTYNDNVASKHATIFLGRAAHEIAIIKEIGAIK